MTVFRHASAFAILKRCLIEMPLNADDLERYRDSLNTKICDLIEQHKGPMLSNWLITKGYLDIQHIYEQELGKIHKDKWIDKTIDKLWISMKNLVFAIQSHVSISGDSRLLEFVEIMIEYQLSAFCSDFEEIVDKDSIFGNMH